MTNIFSVEVLAEKVKLIAFLENPVNLKYWTVHTNLVVIDDSCYEITGSTGVKTKISVTNTNHNLDDSLDFTWILEGEIKKQFQFLITNGINGKMSVQVFIPSTTLNKKLLDLQRLLSVEFKILEQLLNDGKYELTESEKMIMKEYQNKYVNDRASVT
ncbi:hypothetical protein [Flavobacterium sp. GCM10027622]|uniref:hypothetical protein n=1 Tax=unclassified Flavobacterium TaxID=196869 RepID=UPI00360C54F5